MYHLIPRFIHDNYQAGRTFGNFRSVTLFMDISGFTALTETAMRYGKTGAEELVTHLNAIFEPIVQTIYAHGGFISGFAGDGLTVIFPDYKTETALAACETALTIQHIFQTQGAQETTIGRFELTAKQGLSAGWVSWGIVGPINHKTYFFRGEAIRDCTQAGDHAQAGEIKLGKAIRDMVPDGLVVVGDEDGRYAPLINVETKVVIPPQPQATTPLSPEICHQFFSEELWNFIGQGEFRHTCTIFLGFQSDLSQTELDLLVSHVIQESDKFDGHFVEVDFGDKGGLALICFGAPRTHENDPERAMRFMLAVGAKLDEHSFQWRAGISYGLAYAGMVGGQQRSKYALLGSVVNFAARLMMEAEWGQVLVSDVLVHQQGFVFSDLGDFSYKGFTAPRPTYELLGRENIFDQPPVKISQPVFGREPEMAQLMAFSKAVLEKRSAGVVFIYGEPGIGKSTLISDWQSRVSDAFTWLICPTDQTLRQAFNPLIYCLKRSFGQLTEATEAENKARFQQRWQLLLDHLIQIDAPLALRQELERTHSILGALLDLYWPNSLYEQLDQEMRFKNMITAVKSWLFAQSFVKPVALVVEDGHWLDRATQTFLTSLSEEMAVYPLLLVITSRYRDDSRLMDFDLTLQKPPIILELKALPPSSVRQQAEKVLGSPISNRLFTLLKEKSQANPFFVEQLLYYFQENEFLQKDNQDQYTLSSDPVPLPDNINIILTARLDRLPQSVKAVVQTAAVLGNEFEVDLLSYMLQINIMPALKRAKAGQIWEARDDTTYSFKHILLRDSAYSMQMHQQLRHYHQLAATAYIHLHRADLSPHYATLAYHYRHAQNPEQERRYAQLAGEQASRKGNQEEAATYLNQALALTPESERYELRLLCDDVYHLQGKREKQAANLQELADFFGPQETGSKLEPVSLLLLGQQVEVRLRQARFFNAVSDYPAAIEAAQSAFNLSEQLDDPILGVQSRYWWAEALTNQASHQEARDQLHLGLTSVKMLEKPDLTAGLLNQLGWIAFREGKPEEATRLLKEALPLVRLATNRREELKTLRALGGAANLAGDYAAALTWQEEALALARTIGHRREEGSMLNNLGNTSRFLGRYEEAVAYHKQGAVIMRKTGWRMGESISQINLGLALPYLGELDEALRFAQIGLTLAQEVQAHLVEGEAWFVIGNIRTAQANWSKATAAYEQAVRIFQTLSLPRLVIESKAGLLRVYLAQADKLNLVDLVEEIWDYLKRQNDVIPVEEPLRVYWTCYQGLVRIGD
ncbi:MAG: tetratricopeptide repeat protein, partial [Candidatus Promineifilaceae bacterium]